MRTLLAACADNPFLVRHMRTRMRGFRAYGVLALWLGAISVLLSVVYVAWLHNRADGPGGGASGAYHIGAEWNSVLFLVLGALTVLVAPALATGAISGEREQRTMDLLVAGGVSPGRFVAGKLAGIGVFLGWLLFATLPASSVGFLLGGVSGAQVVSGYAVLFAAGLGAAAMGLAISSACRTTVAATLFTYLAMATGLVAAVPLAWFDTQGYFWGGTVPVFRAVHPFAVDAATSPVAWGPLHVPAWVPAVTMHLLLTGIFATVAAHRLGAPRKDLSGPVRLMVGALAASLAVGLVAHARIAPLHGHDSAEGSLGSLPFAWVLPYVLAYGLPAVFATGAGLGAAKGLPLLRRWAVADPVSGGGFALIAALLPGLVACGTAAVRHDRGRFVDGLEMTAVGAVWAMAMVALAWNLSLRASNRWIAMAATLSVPLVGIAVLLLARSMVPALAILVDSNAEDPIASIAVGTVATVAGGVVLAWRRGRVAVSPR